MPIVVVYLSAAALCWSGQCFPALLGTDTPQGLFTLHHLSTSSPGYGGDVLAFARDDTGVYAVHRVWQTAGRSREWLLQHAVANLRQSVTGGCINVMPDVYEKLVSCCSGKPIRVVP